MVCVLLCCVVLCCAVLCCAVLRCSECVLLCLVHWLLYLSDLRLLRVIHKFVERDCEKVDRVLELLDRYRERLRAAGEPIVDASSPSLADYSRRLSSGLYAYQLCALLTAFLYTAGDAALAQHIRAAFYQRDRDVAEICDVLDEQQSRIDEEEDEQQQGQQPGQQTMKRRSR